MRLADFILANVEPILAEWEAFARSIWPGAEASPRVLRDHAEDMLLAVARDMKSAQTASQQAEKSKGNGDGGKGSDRVDTASDLHAISRVASGFALQELVAEYRALRASVIKLWKECAPEPGPRQLDDLIRFNESIDQLLAESVVSYTRRVEQSRDIFLGILGHDLRNPLHAVTLLADILVRSGKLDPESIKMASTISASGNAMGRMIGDLLDFTGTRLGANMIVTPAAMDLEPLCREVLDEMKAVDPARTFTFEPEGDLTGEWDAPRLRQLLSNLLGNAVQHGFATTPIMLAVAATDEAVTLEIRNHGPAIHENREALLFEPMMRNSTVDFGRPAGSIGLGLYVAREVAAAHGGAIGFHSAGDETVFSVRLPRHSR
jgi:signal transduction histidine kinase